MVLVSVYAVSIWGEAKPSTPNPNCGYNISFVFVVGLMQGFV